MGRKGRRKGSAPPFLILVVTLPIVELGAHSFQPLSRDAIRLAITAPNQPALPETLEYLQRAIAQPKAVTVEAVDGRKLAVRVARILDLTTLREHVQHALFML
ncbi:hypothetical protein MACH24_32540 [Erythrobacter sp. Dej080120_24]|nr:hypothetical protein MACH24_32540 [Erythrobacter sp. Dej080120_24]